MAKDYNEQTAPETTWGEIGRLSIKALACLGGGLFIIFSIIQQADKYLP